MTGCDVYDIVYLMFVLYAVAWVFYVGFIIDRWHFWRQQYRGTGVVEQKRTSPTSPPLPPPRPPGTLK